MTLRARAGETDDLGGIGRFSVFLAGAVAGLAALELHAFMLVQLASSSADPCS